MEKTLLRNIKLVDDNGLMSFQKKVTRKILNLPENQNVTLVAGYHVVSVECNPKCRGAVPGGVEICTGGECVFFPNP